MTGPEELVSLEAAVDALKSELASASNRVARSKDRAKGEVRGLEKLETRIDTTVAKWPGRAAGTITKVETATGLLRRANRVRQRAILRSRVQLQAYRAVAALPLPGRAARRRRL